MDWGADSVRDADAETALEYFEPGSVLGAALPPAYASTSSLQIPPPTPMKDRQSSGKSGKSGKSDGANQLPTPLSTGGTSFSSRLPQPSRIPVPAPVSVPAVEKKASTSSQKAKNAGTPSQSQSSKPPSRRQSTSQPQPQVSPPALVPIAQPQRIVQQDSTTSTPSPIAAPVPPPLNQRVPQPPTPTAPPVPQRPPSSQSQNQPSPQPKHQRKPSQSSQISQPPSYSQINSQPPQPQPPPNVPIVAQPIPKQTSMFGSWVAGPGPRVPPNPTSVVSTTAAPSPITPVDRPPSAASVLPIPVPYKGTPGSANIQEPQASTPTPMQRNSSASVATIKPSTFGVGASANAKEKEKEKAGGSGNGTPVKNAKANLERGNGAATPTKAASIASVATQEIHPVTPAPQPPPAKKSESASKAKTEKAPSQASTAAPVSLAATAPPIRASKPSAIPSIAQIFSLAAPAPQPQSQHPTTDTGSSSEDVFSDVPSTGADSLTTEPEQSRIARVLELRKRSKELDGQVVELHKQMEKAKSQSGDDGKEVARIKGREIEKASKKKLKIEVKIRKIFDGFDPLDDPPERVELAKEGVGPGVVAAVEKALEQHLYPGTESQELRIILAAAKMGQKQKVKVLELLDRYGLQYRAEPANGRIIAVAIPPA
ncbi:hypothetical protein BDN72DRAFT_527675 [Pluteus cervinus]|uniref:Uncharacterized protein n=1 Tax=Pluteus cervinus TaxID=181527 RepID=A0ACD3AX81_9AGAR|nr:hypothetical protein BDN72DRAFT_527675 [Pluteus cervinus]